VIWWHVTDVWMVKSVWCGLWGWGVNPRGRRKRIWNEIVEPDTSILTVESKKTGDSTLHSTPLHSTPLHWSHTVSSLLLAALLCSVRTLDWCLSFSSDGRHCWKCGLFTLFRLYSNFICVLSVVIITQMMMMMMMMIAYCVDNCRMLYALCCFILFRFILDDASLYLSDKVHAKDIDVRKSKISWLCFCCFVNNLTLYVILLWAYLTSCLSFC